MHGFGVLISFLADHDFFLDPGLLIDNCLLAVRRYIDRAFVESIASQLSCGHGPIYRPALDLHTFITQLHLLLDRGLDDIAAYPDRSAFDLAFADPQLLFVDRDDL